MLPQGLFFIIMTGLLATAAAFFTSWKGAQQPLVANKPIPLEGRNFSVGFSLRPSYGAASVIFENSDGKLEIHTEVYSDSPRYRSVMAKLSLDSSRHLALVNP